MTALTIRLMLGPTITIMMASTIVWICFLMMKIMTAMTDWEAQLAHQMSRRYREPLIFPIGQVSLPLKPLL